MNQQDYIDALKVELVTPRDTDHAKQIRAELERMGEKAPAAAKVETASVDTSKRETARAPKTSK